MASKVESPLSYDKLKPGSPVVAVIMAGGYGTRFWPASRRTKPKQLLPFGKSGETLLERTIKRLNPLTAPGAILISTGVELVPQVRAVAPEIALVAEPIARNTAPCLGLSALKVLREVGDVPMICLPADQLVVGEEALISCLRIAIAVAQSREVLCTIGIHPTRPETGFGYICCGEEIEHKVYAVSEFTEKPNDSRAEELIRAGTYLWNSGMFVWRPSVFLKALSQHLPLLSSQLLEIDQVLGTDREQEGMSQIFSQIKAESVDFGVLEKASNVVVIKGEGFRWSDVGSWAAWGEMLAADEIDGNENYLQGDGVFINSRGCIVQGGERFIACVGLTDVIVIEQEGALLVCGKNSSQQVKDVVQELKRQKREDLL